MLLFKARMRSLLRRTAAPQLRRAQLTRQRRVALCVGAGVQEAKGAPEGARPAHLEVRADAFRSSAFACEARRAAPRLAPSAPHAPR